MRPVILCVPLLGLLSACVLTPKTVTYYEEGCRIEQKKMILTKQSISNMPAPCAGQACIVQLAALGLAVPLSAAISGTIVLAGNTLYWLEELDDC